ncbi:ROK family protein [Clostridium sp. AL.422]|uniref:ROK family protein n=1 Tax=Clostridium TaxID=1485 RepID=UPI00293DB566|nr:MULTISPECIES: ROK family protein [unclassified Clostridium]MDV4151388.1 ROK family protein [Clostridium sp. AL.422]
MQRILGIDIGGTKIKYGIYDVLGREISSNIIDTESQNKEKMLKLLNDIIINSGEILGVGISLPGSIDEITGILTNAGNIPSLQGLRIKEEIEKRTKKNVEIENDANCVALAEKWIGNGIDSKNFICITIGTAIGGAIVINGELYKGGNNISGEFGFMIIDDPFNAFNTKDYGNLASTRELIVMVSKELNIPNDKINGQDIFNMINENNEKIINIYKKWLRYLAVGIRNLFFILGPEKILIGGGISIQNKLLDDLNEEIKLIVPYEYIDLIKIQVCKFNNNAGKIGAVYNFLLKRKLLNR